MAVNLTRTVAAVISDNTRVDKAPMRDLLNEIIAAINGLDPLLTPSYVNRAAAEAGTPTLAASVNMVIVREGNALLLRSRTAFADDPLFSTGARWGVVQRHDSAAILSELRNGRIWSTGSATPSGTSPQPGTNQMLCVTSTGAALYRPIAAPVPPTETGTYRLDAAGQWWRLVWDSQGSAAGVTALRNALAVSGPIPLSNLRGTANAIVADIAPAYVSAGITTVSDGGELVWVPAAANTTENPTIAIAGDIAREIRRIDGSAFPAAGLVIGQPLVMRRTGGQYRVVRGDVTYAQLAAETAARVAAIASLTQQQITITSGSTLTDRNAALWTAPNRLRRFTDAVIADAPAALAAPHTGTAETLPAAGGSRTIWSDAGGRIFSRTWDGVAHGAWTEQPNQGAFLSVTSALTTTDAAQQTDINALKVETAPQALGRGDNAVIVTISGVPTMTQNPQGETRLRLDRETLEWLSDEMPGGGGGGSASPGSPDLLGGTDGWSVWQDETGLLTFTAVLDPYEYPREYVALPNGEPFINGASRVPLRIVYGDGLGLAPASMAPVRRTQIVTLDDQGGQDGLNGMEAVAPAVGITATGAGFAALSADMFLADAVGPAKWVGVRSEAVVGATLPELTSGQGWLNVLRARDQFVQQLAAYDRIGQFDAVTIMHGAGSDSATYAADLRALVTKLGAAGARQVNVMVPCGTSQRGDFASTLATIEAFRDRGVAPMRLVAPLYAFPRSGLVNPTPEAVTMLAELDALCAADPSWLPPMAFLARRTGNIIDVDFEVMAGFSLLPSAPVTLGLTYSGAAITTAGVVADPLTGLMTRLRITLATAAAGTLRYAFAPAAAEGNMRDNWSVMSRTGQPLYRHALPFQFEVS